jgi:hypothetical protein
LLAGGFLFKSAAKVGIFFESAKCLGIYF